MGLPFKAIIFDFYFTLVDPRVHALDELSGLLAQCDTPHAPTDVMAAWAKLGATRPAKVEERFFTFTERWLELGGDLWAELGIPATAPDWARCRHDAHARAVLYDDVADSLESLRAAGYSLAVLSDADNDWILPCIEASGLELDAVITSEDLRCYKPNPAMFAAMTDRLGIDAHDAVYVGDTPLNDIVGSRNAGMTPVWINRRNLEWPSEHEPPTHSIASLRELSTLFG